MLSCVRCHDDGPSYCIHRDNIVMVASRINQPLSIWILEVTKEVQKKRIRTLFPGDYYSLLYDSLPMLVLACWSWRAIRHHHVALEN